MTTQHQLVNNQIVGIGLSVVGLLLCLVLPWMTFVAEGGVGMHAMMNGMQMTVTGTNGSISLGSLKLPTWIIAALPIVGCLGAVLKSKNVISIGKIPIVIAIGITAPFAILGLFLSFTKASPGLGVLLVNMAICSGAWFAWKAMTNAEQGA